MTDSPQTQPPGWYYAQGDPPGTQRYWDGSNWQGGPQPVPGAGVGGIGSDDPVLADPIKRIVGRVIDGVIWMILSSVVGIPLGVGIGLSGEASIALSLVATLITTALVVAYEVLMINARGATLGKMAMSTRVVKSDGSAADMETALRRSALYIAVSILGWIPLIGLLSSLAFLVLAVAGLAMLFTDGRHQTPWDKIGDTIVVEGG